MSLASLTPSLRQARQHLLQHGTLPPGAVDERLWRSWRRSLAVGLLPFSRPADGDHVGGPDLRRLLERNDALLAHARPVMEYLFEQVRHSQNMVILADCRATLMHTLGDADFLERAERVALTAGASWDERTRGTNAIGTAVAEASSIEIHGVEHFLERNGFLTCTASPIMAASGALLGVLDISGHQRSRHPHTRGLVDTATRMIENRLVVAACGHGIRLHLHPHREGVGTVAEGIVALSADGRIVGTNRSGLALLRLVPSDIGTTFLAAMLDLRLDELLSHHRRRPDQPIQVRLRDGTALFALVHAQATTAVGPSPAASRGQVPDDALAALDTGDARWRSAADKARRVAGKQIPLLIQGESGVGKEVFARAVHDSGPRRAGPFVAINCAALPDSLVEAELFGYAPGAFTGSRREGSRGRLREADGGTLFLDEIGDMPLTMQTRLLRVLQDRQVTPLGGGPPVAVDFALMCATHRNLRHETEQGRFRTDLYYRVNGLTLPLPALRDRGDFPALTERLLARLNPDRPVHLAAGLLEELNRHSWSGNLRQYAGVLRLASAMLDPEEEEIDWRHLPDDLMQDLAAAPPAPGPGPAQSLDALSRAAIRQALDSSGGNISEASRRLGISRQTLYRKIKR